MSTGRLVMRRSFTIALASIALVCALVGGLRAYVAGPSWGTQKVSYYINPQNLYVTNAAAIAAIQSAASNWSTQSSANVQLVNAGTTTANVLALDNQSNVFFRNDSSSYIAETYWWNDASGKIIDA